MKPAYQIQTLYGETRMTRFDARTRLQSQLWALIQDHIDQAIKIPIVWRIESSIAHPHT